VVSADGYLSTTTSGRIRHCVTGRRVLFSWAKPVSMWVTSERRVAVRRGYPHAHRHNIKKGKY
jgi:hypothetical protein